MVDKQRTVEDKRAFLHTYGYAPKSVKNVFIELKSVSDISDEDTIEFAKIIGYESNLLCYGKLFISKLLMNIYSMRKSILVTDFLRKQGYLLPFRNYSEEEIISLGWAKIKQN